jgi:hypothetical protein
MHSAITGVQVSVTRTTEHAHWLAHFAGVYLLWRQIKGMRQKYHIQVLVHWFFFSGVSYCDNRERVFMFDYDTKEKEHQNTRQSDWYSGATPPLYKSDSLVIRCSFYYVYSQKFARAQKVKLLHCLCHYIKFEIGKKITLYSTHLFTVFTVICKWKCHNVLYYKLNKLGSKNEI